MAHQTKTQKRTTKSGARRRRFNPVAVVIFLILLVGAIITIVLLVQSSKNPVLPSPTDESSEQSEDQQPAAISEEEEEPSSEEVRETEKTDITEYEGADPNTLGTITGIINYAGIYEGQLLVRVSIDQTISGTCDFSLTSPSGRTVTGQSTTTSGPSSTFCSYSVPPTESGTWTISVSVKSTDKSGIITGAAEI